MAFHGWRFPSQNLRKRPIGLLVSSICANCAIRILEAAIPKVGQEKPAFIRAEIGLDVSKLADSVRREWQSLRQDDVLYLLSVEPTDGSRALTNGHSYDTARHESGIRSLRTAEVVQVLGDNGRIIRDVPEDETNGYYSKPRLIRIIVNLDTTAYKLDIDRKSEGKPDIYESINVVVRRKGRENNFKKVLETIQHLALSDIPAPAWLQEVFLGYGDPTGATYTKLANRIQKLDFRDTFLDWDHLLESFPSKAGNLPYFIFW